MLAANDYHLAVKVFSRDDLEVSASIRLIIS